MVVHHLSKVNSVLNTFIKEIRDKKIQKDSMRFRRNIERIGEILSYELSKELSYSEEKIFTVLGEKNVNVIHNDLVICSILRAGLPLHQGILNYFYTAEMHSSQHIETIRKMRLNLTLKSNILQLLL